MAAETENAGRTARQGAGLNRGSGGFAYPVSTTNRRFIDQTGKVYLLKTMSSWAISQNCSKAEITQALEGLKALSFNAVTVSPFGVHMNDSFGDRYKNKAVQSFFSGKPHASSLGPAWPSMDWVMREATRLDKDQQNQELRERNYAHATFIRGGAGINFGHEKWWPHSEVNRNSRSPPTPGSWFLNSNLNHRCPARLSLQDFRSG